MTALPPASLSRLVSVDGAELPLRAAWLSATAHAGFAFPVRVAGDRAACMAALEARGIETRPISGSNLARQPAFARVPARLPVPLPVADDVHTQGFFVGNSHAFGPAHGEALAAALSSRRIS